MDFFEKLLDDFSTAVSLPEFLLNAAIAAVSGLVLAAYYNRYGNAISNRRRFSAIFLPLALTTMLIITIIKSSIALSLGMVGALSIVRFRAAIKDPEELTFLFLVIGMGLSTGAGQPLLALLALVLILAILSLIKWSQRKTPFKQDDRLYIHIQTDTQDIERIHQLLGTRFQAVELKRLDSAIGGSLSLSFSCRAADLSAIAQARQSITELSPQTSFSLIEQPDLLA